MRLAVGVLQKCTEVPRKCIKSPPGGHHEGPDASQGRLQGILGGMRGWI